MDNPFISVIIPTYNGALFLRDAIESIRAQHYSPLEIIIVDDKSQDSTPELAKSIGREVQFVSQPNSGGPATGRNRGIQMAKGDIIGFLDQDDLWPDTKLEQQVSRLLQDPSLDFLLGQVQPLRLVKIHRGQPIFENDPDPCFPLLLSSGLFRRSVFDKVGFFNPTLPHCTDDFDWFLRAREHGASMLILNDITLFWRKHGNNASTDKTVRDYDQGFDHGLMQVLKQSLKRRRITGNGSIARLPQFSHFRERQNDHQENR
jgi:glycosyltransferase involved in cell wall biosynthesis